MTIRAVHGNSRSAAAAPPEAVTWLWHAIDQYLDHHPDALGDIGELCLLEPEAPSPTSTAERDALWFVLRRRLRDVSEAADSDPRIKRTVAVFRDWISELDAEGKPDFGQIQGFVRALGDWIATLNAKAVLHPSQASVLRHAVLQSSFPVLVLCLCGRLGLAARYLVGSWQTVAASLGVDLPWPEIAAAELRASLTNERLNHPMRYSEPRLLWAFQTAVFQALRTDETLRECLDALIDLRTTLDLDAGQVGRLFDVPEETIQRWERGEEPIPQQSAATLSEVQDSLQRLRSMFLPERLPQVIRRPAELFGGASALDWVLQGRIRQVADRYDLLLRYQS